MADQSEGLRRKLARSNAIYLGIVVGSSLAMVLWIATALLILQDKLVLGPHLALLEHYLPGYAVSWLGACLGAAWIALFGFSVSAPAAWLYYLGAFHHVEDVPEPGDQVSEMPSTVAHIRIPGFAAAAGLLCGGTLFLATMILVSRTGSAENTGYHLGLLSNFLPRYTVSVGGAFLGFFYFLFVGGALFAITGAIYNALIGSSGQPR